MLPKSLLLLSRGNNDRDVSELVKDQNEQTLPDESEVTLQNFFFF